MRKFEIGEEVTVRAWEDMKKQYGLKNIAPKLLEDSFFGSILKEMFSMELILVPKKVVSDIMKPYCGRKMKIFANPAPDVYILDGAEPFEWSAEAFEEFWKEEEEPETTEVEESESEHKDMPELENGMVVELRIGKRFLVAEFSGKQFLLSDEIWCHLDDMDFKTGKSSFTSGLDIVKVIQPYCPSSLKCMKKSEHIIWEAE